MLSGIYDFDFRPGNLPDSNVRFAQTPAADKKRITYEVGHQFLPEQFPKDTPLAGISILGRLSQPKINCTDIAA